MFSSYPFILQMKIWGVVFFLPVFSLQYFLFSVSVLQTALFSKDFPHKWENKNVLFIFVLETFYFLQSTEI